ncbi:hypothetical protein M011DRAFT_526501 [Sporormia fimetaria CBS 119925]|uniref:Uncharacterized protein n=1 Tax=Sporormia fimetaria CBS 119925 TaxID=1340428 RepID=A0A6A6V938_9PLEO|nr:hypothetical protein M011DRAFT_526501 [Sporormia fimetaria CBS 119925]
MDKEEVQASEVLHEVAEWLELVDRDTDIGFRRWQAKRFPACAIQASVLLDAFQGFTPVDSNDAQRSDATIYFIALCLLASCYTVLPASSGWSLPLLRQRQGRTVVSALGLHWRYRYSPAAGHHARECTETAQWQGLYSGPSIEDQVLETVMKQRRSDAAVGTSPLSKRIEHESNETGRIAEANTPVPTSGQERKTCHKLSSRASDWSDWGDGPAPPDADDEDTLSVSSSITSSQRSFLSKLKCGPLKLHKQAKDLKDPKDSKGFIGRLTSHNKTVPGSIHFYNSVQRIPSSSRGRQTQSSPTHAHHRIQSVPRRKPYTGSPGRGHLRRVSSTPSFPQTSPIARSFIRRLSIPISETQPEEHDSPPSDHTSQQPSFTLRTAASSIRADISTPRSPISPMTKTQRDPPARGQYAHKPRYPDDYFGWMPMVSARDFGWEKQREPGTDDDPETAEAEACAYLACPWPKSRWAREEMEDSDEGSSDDDGWGLSCGKRHKVLLGGEERSSKGDRDWDTLRGASVSPEMKKSAVGDLGGVMGPKGHSNGVKEGNNGGRGAGERVSGIGG